MLLRSWSRQVKNVLIKFFTIIIIKMNIFIKNYLKNIQRVFLIEISK